MNEKNLMSDSATSIMEASRKKQKFDKDEAYKIDKTLRDRYIDFCKQNGIRNSTFERRISDNARDLDERLMYIFNCSSRNIVKNLNEVFTKVDETLIAKDYDSESTIKEGIKHIDTFFERSEIEVDKLLQAYNVPLAKCDKIKSELKIFADNLREHTVNELNKYIPTIDSAFIDSIKLELTSYQKKLIEQETKEDKLQSGLKGLVKSDQEILNGDLENKNEEKDDLSLSKKDDISK